MPPRLLYRGYHNPGNRRTRHRTTGFCRATHLFLRTLAKILNQCNLITHEPQTSIISSRPRISTVEWHFIKKSMTPSIDLHLCFPNKNKQKTNLFQICDTKIISTWKKEQLGINQRYDLLRRSLNLYECILVFLTTMLPYPKSRVHFTMQFATKAIIPHTLLLCTRRERVSHFCTGSSISEDWGHMHPR